MDDPTLHRPEATRDRATRRERWLLVVATLVMLIPAAFIVKNAAWITATLQAGELPAGSFRMEGVSMEPTLKSGDTVFLFRRPLSEIQRGDIIVFPSPLGDMSERIRQDPRGARIPLPSGIRMHMKRVVGVAGDTVEIRERKLYLNGAEWDEPYIKEPMRYTLPPKAVPDEALFVLGDNRNDSADSHLWGPIPGETVLGVVRLP